MAERALATAFVNIVPGTQELESYLKTGVPGAGKSAGQKMAKGVSAGFGSNIKGLLGPMAAAFSAVGASRFVGDMYDSAVEGQKVDSVLGKVADSMGLFGGQTGNVVNRLKDFATQQMKLTGIDDDVIKGAQSKLLTFKELAKSADTAGGMFDRATKISADMAAVFGGSASDKAVILGKALNDPIKGISSLSRVGVQFTDDQKKMIEGMVKAGDMAGAQGIIMKELETQVGGTAEASATAGEKMRARWEDAVQSMGTVLMPVFDTIIGVINDNLVPAVEGISDALKWMGDNSKITAPLLGTLGTILLLSVAPAIWGAVTAAWAWTAALLANPMTWIIVGIGLLVGAIIGLALNWDSVTKWIGSVWGGFTQWLSDSFKAIGRWFGHLWDGITDGWGGFIRAVSNSWDYVTGGFKTAFGFIGGIFKSYVNGWLYIAERFINFFINGINDLISGANVGLGFLGKLIGKKITVGYVPDVSLPRLAKGGLVTQPTTALIGEAGPEVVTPLRDFERMMGLGSGGGKTINYYAAPNQSLDSEQALFDAIRRAKVVAAW